MKEVLRFDNVSMHYHSKQGETIALKNASFSVKEGEFVAIIGPSGCGKTTVLRLLLGLLTPDSGEISGGSNPSVVFQEDRLLSGFSLKTNVLLPPLTEEQQKQFYECMEQIINNLKTMEENQT